MTERVVITGLGVVSCLGNDAVAVKDALFNGRSGISLRQDHVDAGMRSQIAGTPDIDLSEHIDRKQWRSWATRPDTPTSACSRHCSRRLERCRGL